MRDRAAVVERRRHLLDDLGEEPVELRGRDALAVLARDLVDEIEQAIDAVAALRGQHHHRRPRQEVERVLGQLAELRPCAASPVIEVGLVERDHERAAGLLDHAGDPRVLLGRAELGVDHEHDDVGALDLADRHRDGDLLDVGVDLRLAADPGGVDQDVVAAADRERACRPDRSWCRRRGGRASAPRRAAGWSATTCRRWAGRRTRPAAGRVGLARSAACARPASALAGSSPVGELVVGIGSSAVEQLVAGLGVGHSAAGASRRRSPRAADRCRGRAPPRPGTARRGRARGSRGPGRRASGDRSC